MAEQHEQDSWAGKPVAAFVLRALAFLVPIAVSIVFVMWATKIWPRPLGVLPTVSWFLMLFISSTGLLLLVERMTRRLLPIVALLRLTLVFPDEAPSRFKLAMRTNTVRQLQRKLEADELDADGTPVEAAEALLQLANQLNDHDRKTRGHTERVRAYTMMIGEEMGLTDDELNKLHWAGLVHDIGKLTVPAEILNLPGRPNAEQWKILKQHPRAGMDMVGPLRPWLGEWADATGHHHERWDGDGYPYGLAGEDISLAGRIVAVADAFDVITSIRSYKQAGSPAEGRQEIARCAGTQFDPMVVKAFLRISLGRLRSAMGPLSWVAQAPILVRLPVSAAASPLASAAVAAAAVVTAGAAVAPSVADVPQALEEPPPSSIAFAAPELTRRVFTVQEDGTLIIVPSELATTPPDSVVITVGNIPARVDATGSIVVTPPSNFHGAINIPIELCWEDLCEESLVAVQVAAVNDPPILVEDPVASVLAGETVEIDVLANDFDPDGDALEIVAASTDLSQIDGFRRQTQGDVVVVDNRLFFRPPASASRRVRVGYRVEDGNGGAAVGVASVDVEALPPETTTTTTAPTITVTPTTTAPTTTAAPTTTTTIAPSVPTANDDSAGVLEGGSVTIAVLANDTDARAVLDPSTLRLAVAPTRGTAVVTGSGIVYTATGYLVGVDGFAYEICNDVGNCDTATVVVTITDVNNAPSFFNGGGVTVTEDSGAYSGGWATGISPGPASESGQSVTFSVTGFDPTLFTTTGRPSVAGSGALSFTPRANANGTTSLTVIATDNGGRLNGGSDTSASQTVTLVVTPVNDPPSYTAGASTVNATEDTPFSGSWATAIVGGPAEEAGDSVTFTLTGFLSSLFDAAGQPALAADGTLSFTPALNKTGTTTVTVEAKDAAGAQAATATFDIVIAGDNDAPVPVDDAATVVEDTTTWLLVFANDTNADPDHLNAELTASLPKVLSDNGGVLVLDGMNRIRYTPPPDFSGIDTFAYQLTDPAAAVGTATVTVTVTPVNDPPVLAKDSFLAVGPTLLAAGDGLLANDYDEDGDSLVVTGNTSGAHGSAVVAPDGSVLYTPSGLSYGIDSFTYTVTDGAASRTTTVYVFVGAGAETTTMYLDEPSTPDGTGRFDLLTVPLPTSGAEGDHDVDGQPGTMLYDANDAAAVGPTSYTWHVDVVDNVTVRSPISAELWVQANDAVATRDAHVEVSFQDCDAGGVGCTTIASAGVHLPVGPGWSRVEVALGSNDYVVVAGHELVVELRVRHRNIRLATSGDRPSSLSFTTNPAPIANNYSATIDENTSYSVDVVTPSQESDFDRITIVSAPANVTADIDPADVTGQTLRFTPDPLVNGDDFDVFFRLVDTFGQVSDTKRLRVDVTPVNSPPVFDDPGLISVSTNDSQQNSFSMPITGIGPGAPDETASDYSYRIAATRDPFGAVMYHTHDVLIGGVFPILGVDFPSFDYYNPPFPLAGSYGAVELRGDDGEWAEFDVELVELDGGGNVVAVSEDTFTVRVTIVD